MCTFPLPPMRICCRSTEPCKTPRAWSLQYASIHLVFRTSGMFGDASNQTVESGASIITSTQAPVLETQITRGTVSPWRGARYPGYVYKISWIRRVSQKHYITGRHRTHLCRAKGFIRVVGLPSGSCYELSKLLNNQNQYTYRLIICECSILPETLLAMDTEQSRFSLRDIL